MPEGGKATSALCSVQCPAEDEHSTESIPQKIIVECKRGRRRLTREVWCSMNANVLEALAEGAGVNPAVARTAASDLRKGERTEDGDVVRVVRGYTFAPLGRDLYEAGHLMGCRETAVGGDPFKWNKQDRRMAFQGVGGEYDDMVAFPRARMAMMEAGRA